MKAWPAALIFVFLTYNSFATIIGSDNRKKVRSHANNSYSIGVIYANFNGANGAKTYKCTGSLISGNHILTAAHCVYKKEHGGYASDVSFLPSLLGSGKKEDARYFIDKIWVLEKFIESTKQPKFPNGLSDRSDLAILKIGSHNSENLAEKYGYQGYGFLWESEELGKEFHRSRFYSYPEDKKDKHSLWLEKGCKSVYVDESSYTSDCDTYQGASGGPLLFYNPKRKMHYIYGINSGESASKNFFTRISQDYFNNIKNIVEGRLNLAEGFDSKLVNSHPYFGINLENKCHKPVYVAIKYLEFKTNKVVTKSFFRVPSKGALNNIVRTTDRFLGLYAQTYNAELVWSGNDFTERINGVQYKFFMEKLPSSWKDRKFSFSCN